MERSGRKQTRWVIPFLAVCVLLLAVFVIFGLSWWPTTTRQVSGTAVSYQRSQSETGGTPLLIVDLDAGRRVRVRISNNIPVRYGARVALKEIETQLFGFRRYQFVRYVEQGNPADAR